MGKVYYSRCRKSGRTSVMKNYRIVIVTVLVLLVGMHCATAKELFDGVVSGDLKFALKKASEKNTPIFMVIFDAKNPTKSKLDYSLGCFLQYKKTKEFVRQNFIQVLVKSSSRGVAEYIPKNEPLENCLIVIVAPDGKALVTESVYANPDEGLKRVGAYLEAWEKVKKEQVKVDPEQQGGKKEPTLPSKKPAAP